MIIKNNIIKKISFININNQSNKIDIMNPETIFNLKISSIILILGVFFDEITTMACLRTGNCYEVNPVASYLITIGLWSQIDILLTLLCIVMPLAFSRIVLSPYSRIFLLIPAIPGFIRIVAGCLNLALFLRSV